MRGKGNRKLKNRILLVLLLLICATASTLAVMQRMQVFWISDEGAISLTPDVDKDDLDSEAVDDTDKNSQSDNEGHGEDDGLANNEGQGGSDNQTGNEGHNGNNSVGGTGQNGSAEGQVGETQQGTVIGHQIAPGMEAGDHEVTWTQDTKIEIFKTSYENENGEVTVQSDNGDKVVAPGTENSYTFKLKNTGNVALDFKVELSSLLGEGATELPIKVRISNFKNEWIVGDENTYVDVDKVSAIDYGTVGPGRFVYYTLDWMWPFEGDEDTDFVDTSLGDFVIDTHFEFSMQLRTEAVISAGAGVDEGILAPQMGDSSRMVIWITLIGVSLVAIIFLIIFRDKDEEGEEELQVEGKDFESDKKTE